MKAIEIELGFVKNTGVEEFLVEHGKGGGQIVSPDGGLSLVFGPRDGTRGFGLGESVAVTLLLKTGVEVAAAVVGHWLYDILRDRVRTIRLGGRTYSVTPPDLEKLVTRVVETQDPEDGTSSTS